MDANFRSKLKERGISGDTELGAGWAYFVHNQHYQDELSKHSEVIEVGLLRFTCYAHIYSFIRRKAHASQRTRPLHAPRHGSTKDIQ